MANERGLFGNPKLASPAVIRARVKQMLAGAAEATIANSSETKGNYRPAVVDSVPAVVGTIASLIKGRQMDGSNAAERWVNNSMRRAQLASDRTNKTLGIADPKDTNELGLRIMGGLVIPSPGKASLAKGVTKVAAKAPKTATAVKKVAAAAPKTTKAVGKTAKVAAEVAVPFRQTGIGPAGAVGIGMTGVLDPVLEATDPEYSGIGEEVVEAPALDDIDQLMLQEAVDSGEITPEEAPELTSIGISEEEVIQVEEEEKASRFEQGAMIVAAALGGAATVKIGSKYLKSRFGAATDPENVGRFTGKQFKSSALGRKDQLVTAAFDQTQPMRAAADNFLGRDHARSIKYRLDAIANTSLQAKAQHAFLTGELPKVNFRTQKLAPIAEAYAKELSPKEQLDVSDALNAASSLDDWRATGVLASMTKDRLGSSIGPRELEMLVQGVRSKPKLAKYFDAIQQSYRDMAKYENQVGLISNDDYQKMLARRPNYVPQRRNLDTDVQYSPVTSQYSANNDALGMSRSTDAGGGIQGTSGIGNPFTGVFDDWSDIIRRAEHNDIRQDILTKLEGTAATDANGHKLVERVKPNTRGENVHSVKINGREQKFIVRDPELARSLHFTPRVAVPVLEQMRQFGQNFTTGPIASLFNFFNTTAAPIFDSSVTALLKNPGTKIGLDNYFLIGGHAGGLRYIGDALNGQVAALLRDNLMRDVSPLKRLLGPDLLERFTDFMEGVYANSNKAQMDALGITSHTMWGSPDPSELLSGMETIAPNFARATNAALQVDVNNAYKVGDIRLFRTAIEKAKSTSVRVKSNAIVRAYGLLSEAMHNGARYTAFAANRKPDGSLSGNVERLVSDMRRLAADTSKHGASNWVGVPVNASMYGPISMQTLFEVGKRFGENPGNILLNATTQSMLISALLYTSLANDDEALERHLAKSSTQKATSVSLAGGVELPLDPLQRLISAPSLALMDHLSGINEGQFNPEFLQVMENFLEGDGAPLDEEFYTDFDIRMSKAVEDNMPVIGYNFRTGSINMQSIPIASMAIASVNADPGMTRITGEVMPNRTQDITGLDIGEGKKPDSLVNSWMEGMITSIFSSTGRTMLGIADDAYRASIKGASTKSALEMAAQSWRDKAAPSAKIFRPLFGEYESVKNANDLNYEIVKEKEPGIEQAVMVVNKDYRSGGLTGLGKANRELEPEEGVDRPELEGTEALYIGQIAVELTKDLQRNAQVLNAVGTEIENKKAEYLSPLEERNKFINSRREEKLYQHMMMRSQIEEAEKAISTTIGRPFTFREFNPKNHLKPLGEPPQE